MAEILTISECVSTTETTVFLIFLPLMAFVLFLTAFKRDVPIAGIFGGVLILLFGLFLISCSSIMAFLFSLSGVVLLAFFALLAVVKGHF